MALRRLVVAALLGAALSAPIACKTPSGGGTRTAGRATVKLPEPLPLPAQPVAAAHVEQPGRALGLADPWVEESLTAHSVLERGLVQFTTPDAAAWLAPAIDPERTWSSVRLADGEEVAHFPVRAQAMGELGAKLGELSKEGKFGAVRLPERPDVADEDGESGPWSHKLHLAWLREDMGTLTIATSLRGLATGPRISETYGEAPVFVTVDRSMIPRVVPLERVTATGKLEQLTVTAKVGADFDASQLQIEKGALTGLLAGRGLVAGATTRVAEHEEIVKDVISNIGATVDQQPFLLQGILKDMQRRLNAVLRSWDGRVMVGLGPPGHVRLAYGSEDPKRSGVAVLRLLQAVVDNVKLLRNFTSQLPSIRIKKSAGEAAGEPIHLLSVGNAKGLMEPSLHALVDDHNRLRIAMAWSRHAGAGMVVVGPQAVTQLEHWLDASAKGPAGEQTLEDFGAAVVALDPSQAPTLRNEQLSPDVLLGLDATGPRRTLVGRWLDATTFQVELSAPPARLQRDDASSTRSQ
jgi:hypothetical protein